jgi:Tfp pilus assembly protein PilO
MNAPPIDIPRLIRLVTFFCAIAAGALVYAVYDPQVDAAQSRLDDVQANLLSQEVALTAMPRLRLERAALARRYDTPFAKNPEAVFLRELAATVARHGLTLESTSVAQEPPGSPHAVHPALFKQTQVSLELRGTYAHLLAALADLSKGSAIVGIDAPALRRDGDALLASVPATIYEPSDSAGEQPWPQGTRP